jgi:hypothetical protein
MMKSQIQIAVGFALLAGATSLYDLSPVMAQSRSVDGRFQGRGVAQGAAFTRGRSANVTLTTDRDNFSLDMAEPSRRGARVQYRGAIMRRNGGSNNPNSFTLDARVRSFDTSTSLRPITTTAGTCRIEVFDARVVSSTCTSLADDSSTRFLGLEQF